MQQQTQQISDLDVNIKKTASLTIHSFFIIVTLMLITALILMLGISYLTDNTIFQSQTMQYLCSVNPQGQLTWCYKS